MTFLSFGNCHDIFFPWRSILFRNFEHLELTRIKTKKSTKKQLLVRNISLLRGKQSPEQHNRSKFCQEKNKLVQTIAKWYVVKKANITIYTTEHVFSFFLEMAATFELLIVEIFRLYRKLKGQ